MTPPSPEFLRWWLLQREARKWVIYTRSTREGDPPRVLGYGFGRVLHRGKE